MAVSHKTLDAEGVQFHPESILTEHGHDLLANFLRHRGQALLHPRRVVGGIAPQTLP